MACWAMGRVCDLWSLWLRIDQKAETAKSNKEQTAGTRYDALSCPPLHRYAGIFPSFHLLSDRHDLLFYKRHFQIIFGHGRLFVTQLKYIYLTLVPNATTSACSFTGLHARAEPWSSIWAILVIAAYSGSERQIRNAVE